MAYALLEKQAQRMAPKTFMRKALALLMVSTMLAACSSSDLVPPASIDSGTRVGAIQPVAPLPPDTIAQSPYQTNAGYQAGPSPAASVGMMNAPVASNSPPGDGGHYLRAPQPMQSASLAPPISSSPLGQGGMPTASPEEGVNMDSELGFDPDESGVTGLAEEQDSDIAEGVGDQPVVDGIGTDNPRALSARRQPISNVEDDRVIVPPKRSGAGARDEMMNDGLAGGSQVWGDRSPVTPPSRAPVRSQQVAMLRPNNPVNPSGPMSEPDKPFLRNVMPQSEVSCRAELRRMGVEFRDQPRISNGPSCGVDYPVKLSGLSGGIDVKPAVTLNCQVTLAFAKWVKSELAPSARLRYLSGIQKIQPMGGYSCRRMNNSRQRYNPMSEHAKGNAIDIGAIVLKNGHDINVRKKGLFSFREGALLKSVRTDSCKYFNTVLGPGSNAEHWNHFHFDLRPRKGGRRYCS